MEPGRNRQGAICNGAVHEEVTVETDKNTPEDLKAWLDTGQPVTILDVRNPQAWSESQVKLPGAIRMPLEEIEARLDEIPPDRPVVAYCT